MRVNALHTRALRASGLLVVLLAGLSSPAVNADPVTYDRDSVRITLVIPPRVEIRQNGGPSDQPCTVSTAANRGLLEVRTPSGKLLDRCEDATTAAATTGGTYLVAPV